MRKFILILFLFLLAAEGFSQNPPCGPGERFCKGGCFPAQQCRGIGPPPPGLVVPIDKNLYLLVFAGLGLGFYSIYSSRKKTSS